MARIRSLKPEFFTDSTIVQLSPYARLLYQGMWCHADEAGVLEDDALQLKMRILPADPVNAEELVDELVKSKRVRRVCAPDGTAVLVVAKFTEHQRVDARLAPRWGSPDTFGCSDMCVHVGTSPDASRDVVEGQGIGVRDQGSGELLGAADADALDVDDVPSKPMAGWTYSKTLAEWALRHDDEPPPDTSSRSEPAFWLLGVLRRHVPHGTKAELAHARGLARDVILDYLVDVTGAAPPSGAYPLLGRHLVETGDAAKVLGSIVTAVESGAGLVPPHDADPLAALKYATSVRNGSARS